MRNTTLFTFGILASLLHSCSNSDTKTDIKNKIKENLIQYVNANTTPEDQIILDSIVILKIDTLTEKEANVIRLNYLTNELSRQNEITQDQLDIFRSALSLHFDQDLIDSYERDLDQEIEELARIENEIKSLEKRQKSADDKKFKYYKVESKLYVTEKSAAKTIDFVTCANSGCKVVENKDL